MLKQSEGAAQVSPVAAVSGSSTTPPDGAAFLTAATASLLACRTSDEVFDTIGRFLLLLAPESVVVINELSPGEDSLTTVKVYGLDSETMHRASELIGFDPIGRASAIVSEHRDELLGAVLKPIPGDFSQLASYEVPHSVAEAIGEMLGLRSAHSIGITDGTHTFGNIQIYTRAHDSVPEAHLIEYFASHCYSVLMGIKRERDLTTANTRLNQLIDSMVEGLALHEIILDEDRRPVDYRFIEVNPAFEAMTGLREDDLIGRTVREVLPGVEPAWIERYGAVATTGIASSFEDYSSVLGRHYSVVAYCPMPGHFATVVTDITDTKTAEYELAQKTVQLEALLAEREQTLVRLNNVLTSIVNILGEVSEERDPYTAGHQRRVAMLAVAIASKVGMSAEEIEEVRIASLLHDIGKLSIPTEILTKPGKLTSLEFELIKTHSQRGYDIISSANLDNSIAEIVYQHHERCDGTGYPRGLSSDGISPAAKVVMVADVVEAMVSHRPYRAGLGVEPALAEIESGAGSKYDEGVSRACLSCFYDDGFEF